MNDLSDQHLLRDYSGSRSEPAFAELVRRHVDFVYSAALRMVHDPHLAEDITQGAFVALSQNAGRLMAHPVLSGWLHRTTRNLAANAVRSDLRRRAREEEAVAMNHLLSDQPDAAWEHIAPHLDAALGELSEAERDALLLRYFQRKSAREMAAILGVSDDAAQKRVSRAVERVREIFAKRGLAVGASGLTVLISTNAVQAAPVTLAATISAAVVAETTLVATATVALSKAIAMTTLQKTVVAATLVAAVGIGVYEARQNSRLRRQVQALDEQQAPLQEENTRLSNQLAQISRSDDQSNEVRRLQAEIAGLRAGGQDAGRMQTNRWFRLDPVPPALSNFAAIGIAMQVKEWEEDEMNQLATMTGKLRLTAEQKEAIRALMLKRVELQARTYANGFDRSKVMSLAETAEVKAAILNTDPAIKALLSPEQQTAYADYQKELAVARARVKATYDLTELQNALNLTVDQQDRIFPTLYDQAVADLSRNLLDPPRNQYEEVERDLEQISNRLDQRLALLTNVLTESQSEQLEKYRQAEQRRIDTYKRGLATWESVTGKSSQPSQ